MQRLLIQNIGMLATPEGKSARRGADQGQIRVLQDAFVRMEDGVIVEIGEGNDISEMNVDYGVARLSLVFIGDRTGQKELSVGIGVFINVGNLNFFAVYVLCHRDVVIFYGTCCRTCT